MKALRYLVLALIPLLISCGPEQTASELEKKERGEEFTKEKTRLARLSGVYQSDFIPYGDEDRRKKPLRVQMSLYSYVLTSLSVSQVELVPIPSYLAIVNFLPSDGIKREDINWIFNKGIYYEFDDRLILEGPGNDKVQIILMILKEQNGELVGEFINGRHTSPLRWVKVTDL